MLLIISPGGQREEKHPMKKTKVAILLPTGPKFGRVLTGAVKKLDAKTTYEDVVVGVYFDADPLGYRLFNEAEYGIAVRKFQEQRMVERVGAINRLYAGLKDEADLFVTWAPDVDPWQTGWLTKAVELFISEFGRGAGLLELRPEVVMFNAKLVRELTLQNDWGCVPSQYIRYRWSDEMVEIAQEGEMYAKGTAPRRNPEEISEMKDTHIRVNDNVVFNRRRRSRVFEEVADG